MITVGTMRLPQPEPLDDLEAFLRGLEPDGGYWLTMRRLADHDHSGGLMGPPVAGGGGTGAEVTITGTEGVTVVESPANTFALGLTASPDASNTVEIRANGIYSAAGAIPPEYVTDAELAAALGPYATSDEVDTDLANHAAAADPHPGYLTPAEADALFLTQTEGDARYRPIAYVTDVTVTGDNGVGVTESPANTFALATKVSPDSANILVLRANGLYAPAAGTDPAITARITALETSVAALKVHVHELGTFGAGTLTPSGGIP